MSAQLARSLGRPALKTAMSLRAGHAVRHLFGGPKTREELHKLGLEMNKKHHIKEQKEFDAEQDIHMCTIPRDMKFHHLDSVEERNFKRRQQAMYWHYENYGYVGEALAKQGLMDQTEIHERKEFIDRRIKSMHYYTDQVTKPKVSMQQILRVQDEYDVPEDMRVAEGDSTEVVGKKVQEQVRYFVLKSTEALAKVPHTAEQVSAQLAEADKINRAKPSEDDIDELLMEHEDKLAQPFDHDEASYQNIFKEVLETARKYKQEQTVDDWTESGPFRDLGLIRKGTLGTIEFELKQAQALADKRSLEWEQRYGVLPASLKEDPYMLEYDEQMDWLNKKTKERHEEKLLAEAQEAANEGGEGEGDAEAFDVEAEAKSQGEVPPTEEGVVPAEQSSAAPKNNDFVEYGKTAKQRVYLDQEVDHPEWPRIVDGIELSKWEHLKDLDYNKFEDAPNPAEITIMDAFKRQRQFRQAKDNNVTLVPRVHIPDSPHDQSLIAKVLLLYRIHAVTRYIEELKVRQAKQYERAYRDLSKLNLDLPYDPENPWKNKLFEECELILKNQHTWTTGQKEGFMRKMHGVLTSDMFSKEEKEYVRFRDVGES